MSRKRSLDDSEPAPDRSASPGEWRRPPIELHPRAMSFSVPEPHLHEYSTALVTRAVMEPSGAHDALMAPDLHRRLALGTQVMATARASMPMGRGNVDGDDPAFPEAVPRTQAAYNQLDFVIPSYASKAAVAETTRAGNCDFHAAVGAINAVRGMAATDVAAVVVEDRHTFAELRSAPAALPSVVHPHDVILDSWGTGPHAVMREDSAMGRLIDDPAAPVTAHRTNYTEAVIPKSDQAGMDLAHQEAHTYLNTWNVGHQADMQATSWRGRTPLPGDTGTQYPLQDTQIVRESPATLAARTELGTHLPNGGLAEHTGLEHGYMRQLHAVELLGGVIHHNVRNTVPGSGLPALLPEVGMAPPVAAPASSSAPARRAQVAFSAPVFIEHEAAPRSAPAAAHDMPAKSILKRR